MPNLSPFQILPIHIAEAIACYCIGLQRHRHKDRYAEGNKAKRVWLVLHDISRSWMQLARRTLYGSVTLRLSSTPEDNEFTTTLHSRRVIEQSTSIIPHVKKVAIYFDDIIEEPNEEDLEKLGQVWPDDLVFPKAQSLTCYLGSEYTEASSNARNDKYFRWFMEQVRSSFPNLQGTTVEFGENGMMSVSPDILFSKEWNAVLFLSALFRAGRWEAYEIQNLPYMDNVHTVLENAPELIASFYYPKSNNSKFVSQVIKKSAATLEELYYGEEGGGGFKDILFSDDGKVIVYPRLRDLRVFDSSDDKNELTIDKSIVPFPMLQRLRVYSSCVFKDNTLFRGSSNTLTSLDIGMHRGFVDVSQKYEMFLQGAYPNAFHITVTRDSRCRLTLPADEFAEAAFALVSSATQSMTLNSYIPYQHISSVLPTRPYLENIQILHFTRATLNLLEILDIFKYFANVTDFGCCFRGIDSELAAIQDRHIPSHLGTRYSQLVSRLKCWHVYYSGPVSYGDMAVLFVTLAVLCPDFTFVKESENKREVYNSKIGYIISSGLYDEHAERLGHLLSYK